MRFLRLITVTILFLSVGKNYSQQSLSSGENYIYSKKYLSSSSDANPKAIEEVKYIDGLGREKQIISIKGSPSQKDIVTHFEYDRFGRQVRSFLPVPQAGTSNGQIYDNPLQANVDYDFYNFDSRIFSEKLLDNSPLNKLKGFVNEGADWENIKKTFLYDSNSSNEVKKFTVTTSISSDLVISTLVMSGNYSANQLNKNSKIDENNNKVIEFTNGLGQTILVRKVISASENADTYYIYDNYGRLVFVLPPLASKEPVISATILDQLCYQYKFDIKGRLAEKKLPGSDWEYMVYDTYDRLVFSQDGNLRTTTNNFGSEGWLFNKYDSFGRVVYSGFTAVSTQRFILQNFYNSLVGNNTMNEEPSDTPFTLSGMSVYYTNQAVPIGIHTILNVNYYDKYPASSPSLPSKILKQSVLGFLEDTNVNTKGLLTASYVKNIDTDLWSKQYTFYDYDHRAIGVHSLNPQGGYTKTETLLDFSGAPKEEYTYHKLNASSSEIKIKQTYTHDHLNRVLKHTHQINDGKTEVLTQNHFNELNQLFRQNIGGQNALQAIDYKYNIRGWLTDINNVDDINNFENDLFRYRLYYNNPKRSGLASGAPANFAQYNGNISYSEYITSLDNIKKGYIYYYDPLNRLTSANYRKGAIFVTNSLGEYGERVTYDLNGNITSILRNGVEIDGQDILIDDLTYSYNFNQLLAVTDQSNNNADGFNDGNKIGNDYSYDVMGNLTKDLNKGITNIKYNFLSLPSEILFSNGSKITYTYDATGQRLSKKIVNNNVTTKIDYNDGFHYENGVLKFFPHNEGFVEYKSNKYIYNYIYKDHLGNNRLIYADLDENGEIDPINEIIEESNYYPFGLKQKNINDLASSEPSGFKYKYGGKEWNNELNLNLYDFGARNYDPAIGRWLSVDPLAEDYFGWSPYNYTYNNPINWVDPSGMSVDGWIEQLFQGHMTYTFDPNVNTIQEATDNGYDNVLSVESSGSIDGLYDLNVDGTVSTMDGSKIDWQRSGKEINSSFSPNSKSTVQTSNFDTYMKASGPSVFSPPPGSGRITSIGGAFDLFGLKEMFFGEVATATGNPYTGMALSLVANKGKTSVSNAVKSNSKNLQSLIRKGQAPRTIKRFDRGKILGEKDHVHFTDGSALNIDGTWKHGLKVLTNKEIKFLKENGWTIP